MNALAQASADVGDPPPVQNELLRTKSPPGGGTLGFWVRQYVEIRARHMK